MIYFLTISEFIGRFHPLLVHLPVGILLLAVVFYYLSKKGKFSTLSSSIKYILLFGALSAVLSCITGYLLSNNGEYDTALVSKHQWFGIGMTVVSLITYYLALKNKKYFKWLMPLIAILLIITGHLGGTLTHGEGYLTQSFSSNKANNALVKPIPDVQQAVAYADIVKPILHAKCYGCHSATKQKGQLRLDEPSFIMQGGEEGKIIVAGGAGESEMIKRLLLPLDNKDHMPPKAKPQLTSEQIELLSWWVNSGADFHKKVTELNQPEKIKPYLNALQSGEKITSINTTGIPDVDVAKAPDSIIRKLISLDVAVNPVAQNSNYLAVNFVAVDSITIQHQQLLKMLDKQIIWLKTGTAKLSEQSAKTIAELKQLTKLAINTPSLTDNSLVHFNSLTEMQYLNLAGTGVTENGLSKLSGLKKLQQLFVYQSKVSTASISQLKKTFPTASIDTGGYKMEFLQSDIMKALPKPQKK